MTTTKVAAALAWAVITLDGSAGLGYFIAGDWKRGLLWWCWGLGTYMVTIL